MNSPKPVLSAALMLGCLFISLGLTGCGPKGVSDQALATDIQAKLFADPAAKTANVKVAVNNGIVTLTGDAPTSDVALQVVNIANGTTGIKSVDNQLKIVLAADAPPPAVSPKQSSSPMSSSAMSSAPMPPPVAAAANTPPPPVPATQAAESTPPPPPAPMERHVREEAPPPPRPSTATVPAGTDLTVRMIDGISSKTAQTGQTFRASLALPLAVDGETVIPAGADVSILLDEAKGAGRIKGNSELEVRAVSIQHHGRTYKIDTNANEQVGKGRGKESAIRTGIGAAAGGIIGALAGGGKGAAIGTLAGGGAGAGVQMATHGQQVTIASETQLTFRLQSPLIVTLRGTE